MNYSEKKAKELTVLTSETELLRKAVTDPKTGEVLVPDYTKTRIFLVTKMFDVSDGSEKEPQKQEVSEQQINAMFDNAVKQYEAALAELESCKELKKDFEKLTQE